MNQYTLEQFGQKIKAKYPQYANMSDADVGQATLKKYPEYSNQVLTSDPTQKNKAISTYSPEAQQSINDGIKAGKVMFEPSPTGGEYIYHGDNNSQGQPVVTRIAPSGLTPLGEELKTDLYNRADRVDRLLKSDANLGEKIVGVTGQGAGLVANAGEKIATQIPGVKQAVEGFGAGVKWLSETSPIQWLGNKISDQKAVQDVVKLYDTDQNFKDTVDGTFNWVRLYGDAQLANDAATFINNAATKVSARMTGNAADKNPVLYNATNRVNQYDRMIKDNNASPDLVYSNPATKVFKPDIAQQIIDDTVMSLQKEGLTGQVAQFKSMVDVNNLTPSSMTNAVNSVTKVSPKIGSSITGAVNKISEATGAGDLIGQVKGYVNSIPDTVFGQKIPPQVQTALKESSSKTFDTYSKLAQDAAKSNKAQTPLEFTGTRAQEALDTVQRKLTNIGETKSAILDQAQVGNKPVGNIVVKFRQQLGNFLKGKTNVEGDSALMNEVMAEAKNLGNNPSAAQVDKFVDFVQDKVYTAKRNLSVPVTDQATGALRGITGELNSSLKSQLPESYRALNAKYADMVQTRNELNLKLGMEGEKGGALMKRVFSPSDANTKKLFADIKKITGIDLVDEATLARYVMEVTGDARQASMLQQLQLPQLSSKGLIELAKDLMTKKFNTPEEILKRARELTSTSQIREATLINKSQVKNQPMAKTTPKGGQITKTTAQSKNAMSESIPPKKGIVNKKNLQGGYINFGKIFSDLHPEDQSFLSDFAMKVKTRKAVSAKDWKIAKDTLVASGFNVPKTKAQLADLIATAEQSAFDKTIKI